MIRLLTLLVLISYSAVSKAQAPANADELFKAAHTAAFEQKDNDKAKQLAKQALIQSPHNADIEVFLGRLYAWNHEYDTAVYHYSQVLKYAPDNEEVSIGYTDLEYWNDHYDKALLVCNNGLSTHPASSELLLRKAKILVTLKQYKEAQQITTNLLQSNKQNTEALVLASTLKDAATLNKIGVNYEYSHFSGQSTNPWHLAGLTYSRSTKIGTAAGNINYANRFGNNGWQAEVETYPRISKTFYSYVSAGYSPTEAVFPKYRAGFSLYAKLPRSYDAEAGLRYLHFGSATYVYTAYIGKYFSNLLVGARTYLTPGSAGAAHSYSFSARYYLGGADDYIDMALGTGISPDDRSANIHYSNKNRLSSRQAALSFNHSIAQMNIISVKAGWLNQEFDGGQSGNQVTLSIGWQRRF